MRTWNRRRFSSVLLVVLWAASAAASRVPVTVSPGTATGAQIGDRCPTFIWGAVPGARLYELVVYRLGPEDEEPEPVLQQEVPGSADGWTPSLDLCLERGGRYAWSVRALGVDKAPEWSTPALFQVAAGPTQREFESALATVRQYLALQQASVAAVPEPARSGAGHPDEEEGAGSAGSSPTALIPDAPETVSFVTEGAIGVGTATPLADLHVIGDADNTAGVLIATAEGLPAGVAELMFAETPEATFGMKLRYDGVTDTLTLLGQTVAGGEKGPWLEIDRDTGAAAFGGTITGNGSGLALVNADTLDGMDSTSFSTGAHTIDTDTTCDGQFCDGTNISNVRAVAGDSATGFFPSGQIEEPRIADAITRDSELAAAVGKITVYQTSLFYPGSNALTACATGYHMASAWEIPDPLQLVYDNSVSGAHTAYDGAGGLPVRRAWMRSGGISRVWQAEGANCALWTSSSGSHYGSLYSVLDPGIHGTGWDVGFAFCSQARPVWCVKN